MPAHSLDATTLQQLQAIIERCDFLQLTSSREQYPYAPGSGLPLLLVNTPLCSAVISLQGAQLLQFAAEGGSPLLWLSPNCDFTPGTALRGGVPLCLPWFGPHPQDSSKPKHGFARNQLWQLADARALSNGEVELEFLLVSSAGLHFPYDFSAELRITLGQRAHLALTVNNTDDQAFDCSWALHNYHPVSNLNEVSVLGLAERDYKDNFEAHAVKHQSGDLRFPGPVDRVFPAIDNTLEILGTPRIAISHHNCPSVITWNPGSEAAANISDIGAGQEQFYICVERGAVLDEQWHLAPGSSRSAWVEFRELN